jgi:site-specific DNA recombinase
MSIYPLRGTRAAIYARCAAPTAAARAALDQVRPCQAFADRQGWTVVHVFQDVPGNGARLVGREGLFAMMAAAERGEFDVVLAQDLDRLSRNASDIHQLLADLGRLGVGAWTLDWGAVLDFKSPFQSVLAQSDRRHRREVRRPNQAAIAKRIYEDFLAGASLSDIADALNAEGVSAPKSSGRRS